MSTDEHRRVVHYSTWAFLIHGLMVVVTVIAKHAFWGTEVPWWWLDRLLILIDKPMEWVIRPSLQSLPFLPGWLVFNSVRVAAGVNEIFLRSLLGGVFYVVVVAVIAAAREAWKRQGRAAASESRSGGE